MCISCLIHLRGSLEIPFFLKGNCQTLCIFFTTGWSTWWWSILCLSRIWWQLVFHVKKVTYIPNFVNKEKWHPSSARRGMRLRYKLGLSNNQFIVVGAGQVQKRKGIDDFIRLAEELPSNYLYLGRWFSLVG